MKRALILILIFTLTACSKVYILQDNNSKPIRVETEKIYLKNNEYFVDKRANRIKTTTKNIILSLRWELGENIQLNAGADGIFEIDSLSFFSTDTTFTLHKKEPHPYTKVKYYSNNEVISSGLYILEKDILGKLANSKEILVKFYLDKKGEKYKSSSIFRKSTFRLFKEFLSEVEKVEAYR